MNGKSQVIIAFIYLPYYRVTDARLAIAGSMRLIDAVRRAVPTECMDTARLLCLLRDCIEQSELDTRNDDVWQAAGTELQSLPLSVLVPQYTKLLKKTLEVLKKCFSHTHTQSPGDRNLIHAAIDNGQTFIHIGLMQTYLLAPQGPVDPAEKQTILLQYTEQEVSLFILRFGCLTIE